VRKITWYQLVTLSAVLIISLLLFSTVFQAQAANFDLTGSCLGGVGDVPALIAAINAANANGEADTITVAAGCVYTLNAIDNVTGGNNGLPSITSPIVIEGNGATIRRDLSAQDEFRLFHVADTGALTLDNLTVENGAVDEGGWSCPENCGGGIYAGGALTLTKTTLRHNRAAWDGGGLYGIDSTLLITASTIFSNTASEGGGILLAIEGGDLTAVVENSQIVSNTSELDGGGIFIYGVGDYALTLALNRSAVNFNQTTINGFGGGIGMWANVGDITLNIDDSAIDWNIASRGGGGIQYSSYGAQVSVNLNRSTVNWNQALDEWDGGGGIASTSDGEASMQLNLIDSTVNGNQTGGQGGGIANTMGQMTLTGSTVSNNQANQNGGGIYNAGALSLVNCTVSDNQTAGDGGGLLNYDVLHLTHVTVAGNTADSDGDDAGDGGGLFQGWTATLTNTILSNNVDDSPTGDVFTDCYQTSWEGEVTNSGGYNLVQNVPGCTGIFTATGDITGSDPLLGPLDDNGGPTWTRALLAGSPARDIVPNGINGCGITITVDQRGTARPFPAGGACDTGAYEALITHIITPTAGAGGSITPGTPQTVLHGDDITFSIAANAGYHIVDVGVDGVSQGVLTSYAFLNVTADHTISATFAINTYVITPTAGAGGSITPGTPQTVHHGDDITFTIAADTGYHIVDVGVDGVSQGALASYAFLNVTADHTISATFALNTYVITPTAGAGGSLTPGTPQTVNHGDDITFTVAADAGYHVVDVGVDGVSQGALASYAFLNVTADHTISATFALNTYVITPTAGTGGSLTPGTPQTVLHGDDITFTVAADAGYHVVDVGVDGVSQGALASYAFLNVTADHTISATFALDEVVERYFVYLPLVLRQQLPDLIVRSITVSPTGLLVGQPATITVVIENTGSFTTTAGFWVDLYIDPDPALMPPQVNQTWDLVGSQYGLAWGVTQSLAPGEQVTLTSLSYVAEYSDWPGYFNCNGPHTLYAQVDSYSGLTTYGAIAEADETNNVYGPVEVTVVCPEWLHSACLISSPARSDKAYPPRP